MKTIIKYLMIIIMLLLLFFITYGRGMKDNYLIRDVKKTFKGEKVLEGEQLTDLFRSQESKNIQTSKKERNQTSEDLSILHILEHKIERRDN